MGSDREQKDRCSGGKPQPEQTRSPDWRRRQDGGLTGHRRRWPVPLGFRGGAPGGETAEYRENDEPTGPYLGLRTGGEVGFDQEGITQQRQHGREIGEGEEAVGQSCFVSAR